MCTSQARGFRGLVGKIETSTSFRAGPHLERHNPTPRGYIAAYDDHDLAPTLVDQAYRIRRGGSARRRCPGCQGGASRWRRWD